MNLLPFRDTLASVITDTPIYMYHMPEKDVEAILLLHSMSGVRLDANLPGYKKGKLQAIIRSDNFESGYAIAKSVIDAFKVVKSRTIGSVYLHFVEPLQDPVAFPKSKGNFIEFSVNFTTAYTEN